MHLLLEFLFDEHQIRRSVFPKWQAAYDTEYLEHTILVQLQSSKQILSSLLTSLRKLVGAVEPLEAVATPQCVTIKTKEKRSGTTIANTEALGGSKTQTPNVMLRISSDKGAACVPLRRSTAAVFPRYLKGISPIHPEVNKRRSTVHACLSRLQRSSTRPAEGTERERESEKTLIASGNISESPRENHAESTSFAFLQEQCNVAPGLDTTHAHLPRQIEGPPRHFSAECREDAGAPTASHGESCESERLAKTDDCLQQHEQAHSQQLQRDEACAATRVAVNAAVKGGSAKRSTQCTVSHPFRLRTATRPSKLGVLLREEEERFRAVHIFKPQLSTSARARRRPHAAVRHTVTSLLRAERLLLLKDARQGTQQRASPFEQTDARTLNLLRHTQLCAEAEERKCRVAARRVRDQLSRTQSLRAANESKQRLAVEARLQRQRQLQSGQQCVQIPDSKQSLVSAGERSGVRDSLRAKPRLAMLKLLGRKRLRAEQIKCETYQIRKDLAKLSLESAVKRRVATARLRRLQQASVALAEMKRAAAVRAKKDITSTGTYGPLFLGSMSLLETRIRSQVMKRRAFEAVEHRRAEILDARKRRCEALANKAARIAAARSLLRKAAEDNRRMRFEKLKCAQQARLSASGKAALLASAWDAAERVHQRAKEQRAAFIAGKRVAKTERLRIQDEEYQALQETARMALGEELRRRKEKAAAAHQHEKEQLQRRRVQLLGLSHQHMANEKCALGSTERDSPLQQLQLSQLQREGSP
ncbi:hypothetical protein cyc_08140 [Cyclospora cayetanensis]|uniref:Uncharacterized protein n=1 Tax=Cyclospora cayetanensis TaxID=88456 RepID=A0A1D3CQZ1_9EIME|nr:hypothetical protein cyc_08140 [Cyclospora cayetanensis]